MPVNKFFYFFCMDVKAYCKFGTHSGANFDRILATFYHFGGDLA